MPWQSTTIASKRADVYEPASLAGSPRFGLLFLHPYGLETLVGNATFERLFEQHRVPVVSPHGQRSWWCDRICAEFDAQLTPEKHILQNVLPYFRERWNLHPRSIGLFGISMGGQGAIRLAFKRPDLFPVAAGISSAIDYHELYGQGTPLDDMYTSKEQCRQDTATMHVPPHDPPRQLMFCIDPTDYDWIRGNDRLHEKMNALGVEHVCDLETEAGGHSWEYFDAMAKPTVDFVIDGLIKEGRRLI